MKKFRKSVHICQSHYQTSSGFLLRTQCAIRDVIRVTFVRCCCCVTHNATSLESISNINTHTLSKFSIHATTLSDRCSLNATSLSACTDSNVDCLSCCHWTKPKGRIQGCAVQRQRLHCSPTAIAYIWNKSIALQRSNNMLIAIRSRSSSLTAAVTAKRHQSCHEGRAHVTTVLLREWSYDYDEQIFNVR